MNDAGKYCDAKSLAQLWGVTTRRVQQLSQDGTIKTELVGKQRKYNLVDCTQKYIKFLSDSALGRQKNRNAMQAEAAKLEAEIRYKNAKADMVEKELAELDAELHSAADVEAIMSDHVLLIRSMLLSLPGRLAVDTANAKTAQEASDIIKKEVHQMLNSLSQYEYDPSVYQERARDRHGWRADETEEKVTADE